MDKSKEPSESIHTSEEYSDHEKLYIINEEGLLEYEPSNPDKPGNWSQKKKLYHTVLFGLTTFAAQLDSTAMSTASFSTLINEEFGIEREVSLLTSSLYILGIALGPMVFAPLSEVYGRKIGVLIPFLCSAIFTFAVATCYNVPSLMIFRFLSGFFAGAPIVSAGGVLADLYPDASVRGKYFAVYALFVSMGPSYGPTIASLLMYSEDKPSAWRIPQYFSGLLNVVLFVICEILLDETYVPVLLQKQAKKMRIQENKWEIHSRLDMWQLDFKDLASVHLVRPFAMLVTPIVFTITLFASYVYGVFYLIITTMPESFTLTRGWEGTISTLPNISLFIGVVSGCVANMFWAKKYGILLRANNFKPIPEERFPILMYGAWLMPTGIFIFAWTSSPNIHWVVPCIGISCIGFSFILIFQGSLNYLVDTYTKYSASAIACATFLRSIFAASYPLFAKQLFVNLGVHWGASVIGFIALGMVPIPFVFYKYGAAIRQKNPYKGV
ncbi:hypothetical protein DASC09_006080 [Saccharomycopsis crataegensis]|uniref:Major facilitator superfamily (MFS) profile domain-containing protein n=1 Tax=Saccharomycopsis crataegensis TaxID=43959 RepID=A0AAV5QGH6_9ASCO|nr:hypothetical protein DASC09_006080 [Saccharomycopsis crataegensis]